MKTILCYGDSNTWGKKPGDNGRFPRDVRWPGYLQHVLGDGCLVVEEGLYGRTTVWDDPIEGIMSGKTYLRPCLLSHMPLDLVIVMLGTNDLKLRFSVSSYDIAEGASTLIHIIQTSETGPDGAAPKVLLLSPPALGELSELAEIFSRDAREKSKRLAYHLKRVADLRGCAFYDTSDIIVPSDVDGVHFTAQDHRKLGETVSRLVKTMA